MEEIQGDLSADYFSIYIGTFLASPGATANNQVFAGMIQRTSPLTYGVIPTALNRGLVSGSCDSSMAVAIISWTVS